MTLTGGQGAIRPDTWLNDSRVYALIWLGRWLERAENVARALDARAIDCMGRDEGASELNDSLRVMALAWGINVPHGEAPLLAIIRTDESSSLLHALNNARDNANYVAPLETVQAVNRCVLLVQEWDSEEASPKQVHAFIGQVVNALAEAYEAIEKRWFRREPVSEEEVYRRFIQQ